MRSLIIKINSFLVDNLFNFNITCLNFFVFIRSLLFINWKRLNKNYLILIYNLIYAQNFYTSAAAAKYYLAFSSIEYVSQSQSLKDGLLYNFF